MKENNLLKIALISSIAGITLLFLISGNIDIDEKSIAEINKESLDEFVKVKGTVTDVFNSSAVTIIEVTQPQTMNVVLFNNKKPTPLKEGDYIEVIGKIDEYNGDMEVIGDKVRVIR